MDYSQKGKLKQEEEQLGRNNCNSEVILRGLNKCTKSSSSSSSVRDLGKSKATD